MNSSDIELIYELSPMQQAMLFHSLYAPGSGIYVLQTSLRLTGRLDAGAFERAWRLVVARHGILRTAFFWENLEKPLQVVGRERRNLMLEDSGAAVLLTGLRPVELSASLSQGIAGLGRFATLLAGAVEDLLGTLARGPLEVVDVPGDHYTLLVNPDIETPARLLSARLA